MNCQNVTITGNGVHDNSDIGIMYEISQGGRIVGNSAWNNGVASAAGWGSNIFVASLSGVEVANNTVLANGTHGILVVSQDRADNPTSRVVRNVVVHDNVVVMD